MKILSGITICVLLMTACSASSGIQATPVDSSQAKRVVWTQDPQGEISMQTMPLYYGLYVLDLTSKQTGMPGGAAMTLEGDPIPLVMYSIGSIYADYTNAIFDIGSFSASRTEPVRLAAQYLSDGTRVCDIQLNIQNLKEIFISTDSVVFPDSQRVPDRKGPFVTLTFLMEPGISGTLLLTRNGEEIESVKVQEGEEQSFLMKETLNQNDVIEWNLVGNDNINLFHGTLGFPMRGAIDGLVEYLIDVNGE